MTTTPIKTTEFLFNAPASLTAAERERLFDALATTHAAVLADIRRQRQAEGVQR